MFTRFTVLFTIWMLDTPYPTLRDKNPNHDKAFTAGDGCFVSRPSGPPGKECTADWAAATPHHVMDMQRHWRVN